MRICSLIALVLLCGCNSEQSRVPVLVIEQGLFAIDVRARGELEAVDSTSITAPVGGWGPMTLAWVVTANTAVAKGDVVARFDDADFLIQQADANFELEKVDFSSAGKGRELELALLNLGNQTAMVDLEMDVAERFTIENELLYSRMEIIDSMRDKQYLNAQTSYYDRLEGRYGTKSRAEQNVLDAKRSVHQAKLRLSQDGLNAVELLAPHDGIVVLEKNWWGEPPRVGQSMFPGNKLASLPDLSQMQAKLFVPEVEAVGIRESQTVELRLDAFPDRVIQGRIESLSQAAQSRERDNPVKYFTITALLLDSDSSWLLPGQRVSARIVVDQAQDVLSAPNQAVFQGDGVTWVFRQDGASFSKQVVTLGRRSTTRSEIVEGLNSGDVIALMDPFES